MRPDRTNYEIWLIDYLDGNLNPRQERELIGFMDENPDIKEEFEALSEYIIKPAETLFASKELLKKSVSDLSETQFELLCVAASENDLSARQRDEMQAIIEENPARKETFTLINGIKLVAPDVKFNKKSTLRKLTAGQKVVRLSVIGLSAAAGLAIMISIFNVSVKQVDVPKSLTASNITNDTGKVHALTSPAIANNNIEKQEISHRGGISVIYTLNNAIASEAKTSLVKQTVIDSSQEKQPIEHVNISKIDFKQNVNLVEKEFTSTLLAINTKSISITEIPEKPGFINAFFTKVFREKILKSKTPEAGSIKGYEIADVGINGLNKLLGWQMSLQKTRDEKGDIKSLYFSSKILKFNAPLKKDQL
jgi:hypothetical protein